MMRQYELVERVLEYDPEADEALLNRAYVYAMKAHAPQTRASGAPYFTHPLEVAAILTELKLDSATVAAALLHDVIEDTEATRAEIDQLFGPEIGALVDGLTKIKRLDLVSKQAEQAENFRKLLIAITSDLRVLLVKLADRLHNMRTLEYVKSEKRKRISEETLDIYAPLAGRMGMQALREELEGLSFRWLHPTAYSAVTEKLASLRDQHKELVSEIQGALEQKLATAGIEAQVVWREKKPYAIWRKMENKQISLEQLSDIYAFRVIVSSIDDCYRVLGVAHTTWSTVPGRFKDYISTPKQNRYQSIHTLIVGPEHQRIELQIRTKAMHHLAEYGVAAHALYKDGEIIESKGPKTTAVEQTQAGPYIWLRQMVETLLEGANSQEFLEHTKLELFQDQVFCFSPKGRLIALPYGATALDFGYAVHTDVGNHATSAFVNGRRVPIDTRLRNGDEVEIVTSAKHMPPAAWENFAVTGRARSAIRRAAREAVRHQYSELGRRIMFTAMKRLDRDYTDNMVEQALPRLAAGPKTVEDVLAGVARNEIPVSDVLRAIDPQAPAPESPTQTVRPKNRLATTQASQAQDGWFNLPRKIGLKFRLPGSAGKDVAPAATGAIPIRGLRNDVPIEFADGAVPGDRIVGVLAPEGGVRIYQVHSPRLQKYEHQDWIDVAWDIDAEKPERFPARISVTIKNEPGMLAQIAHSIGEADGNIDQLRMTNRGHDFTEMYLDIEVWDVDHLNRIISGLNSNPEVNAVTRLYD